VLNSVNPRTRVFNQRVAKMLSSKSPIVCSYRMLLWSIALLCGSLAPVWAQVSTGTFTGTVSDQTGALIPGVKITATDEARNVSVSRETGRDGFYTIADLKPGFYTLRAEARGFRVLVNQHVELTVGYVQ